MLLQLARQAPEWAYGYDLCRTLDLKAGTVYPILIRLSERGLVETSWEQHPPSGRPPRHLYRLSTDGRAIVDQLRVTESATPEPTALAHRVGITGVGALRRHRETGPNGCSTQRRWRCP